MRRRFQCFAPLTASVVAVLVAAAPALAKGGGYLDAKGVIAPSGSTSQPPRALVGPPGTHSMYVAQPTDDGTALARVDLTGKDPIHTRIVAGGYSIPTVAIDKSTSGISADGSTLVLSQRLAGLSQPVTHFEILNGKALRRQKTVSLRGAYSFDAISPNGDRLYLIEYTSVRNPSRYLVRAYDVSSGHLLQAPVIDPDEKGEPMTGKPVTRTMSTSGQWAYTLYQGSDEGPFVHALDTTKGEAVCVDLAGLVPSGGLRRATLSVSPDGGQLAVMARNDQALAVIDTNSLEASAPSGSADGGNGGLPWVLIAIAAALGLGAGAVFIATRRHRGSGLAAPDA
jgi:DNA-binding beta-propeller fold protein YncE